MDVFKLIKEKCLIKTAAVMLHLFFSFLFFCARRAYGFPFFPSKQIIPLPPPPSPLARLLIKIKRPLIQSVMN